MKASKILCLFLSLCLISGLFGSCVKKQPEEKEETNLEKTFAYGTWIMDVKASSKGKDVGFPRETVSSSGMSGALLDVGGKLQYHNNHGEDMWLTYLEDNEITYDLGTIYPLGEMWIWNYNKKDEEGKYEYWREGMREVEIFSSLNGTDWTRLEDKTFEFAPADASEQCGPTNLNTKNHPPVNFNGTAARYVKIKPVQGDKINWGGSFEKDRRFGLSEVRFFTYGKKVEFGDVIPVQKVQDTADKNSASGWNLVNHAGMSDPDTVNAVYKPVQNAKWSSASAEGGSLIFDLGGTFPLNELHIWNAPGDMGMRKIKISHSIDGNSYTELKGEGYPYELAKANDSGKASNLSGTGRPIQFSNVQARFVKLEYGPALGEMSWGGTGASLSQVRFVCGEGMIAESANDWSSLISNFDGIMGGDGGYSINLSGLDARGSLNENSLTIMNYGDAPVAKGNPVLRRFVTGDGTFFANNCFLQLKGSFPDPAKRKFLFGTKASGLAPTKEEEKTIFKPGRVLVSDSEHSTINGTIAGNTRGNYGMSGYKDETDTHDNNYLNMWLSADKEENWIQYDLGKPTALSKMLIWNYNEPGHTGSGLKNIKISYSDDQKTWKELTGNPFTLSQAQGRGQEPASNQNDGKNSPIPLDITARYIKIEPQGGAGSGNWGGSDRGAETYGLSEVRFYEKSGELLPFPHVEAGSICVKERANSYDWLADAVVVNQTMYYFGQIMEEDLTLPPMWQFKSRTGALFAVPVVPVSESCPYGLDFSRQRTLDCNLALDNRLPGVNTAILMGAGFMNNTKESGAPFADGYVYIYGFRDDGKGKEIIVARFLPENIENFNQYRYYDGKGGWTPHPQEAGSIGDFGCSQISVTPMKGGKYDGKYLMVKSAYGLGPDIELRVSDTPYGPFRSEGIIYHTTVPDRVNEVWPKYGLLVYSVIAHPNLSGPDELLVSYCLNGGEFFGNTDTYTQRFIRLRETKRP